MYEEEVWKAVVGYEGLYEVSNLGQVRSLDRVVHNQKGYDVVYKSQIMKQSKTSKSTSTTVGLCKDNARLSFHVDVLVATAFLGDGPDGTYVGHLDGNELNNRADNLVWVTPDEYLEIGKRCLAKQDEASDSEEVWADLPGHCGFYQVSNIGRVRSLPRIVMTPNGPVKRCGKVVAAHDHYRGYREVRLNYNGNSVTCKVHRLVAETFIPNPDNLPEVDHIDMNRANNRVENLQWITHVDNCRRSIDAGTYADNFSKAPKYGRETKRAWAGGRAVIRDDGVIYSSISEAAKKNGCKDRCSIKNVLAGRTQTCNGHSFSYMA